MNRLAGKTALITGAARGIGAAIAEAFVAEGAFVIISDINAETGAARAAALGENAHFMRHDATDEAQWAAVMAAIVAGHGGLDVLVNNAGSLMTRTLFMDWDDALYDRVMNLNVRAVITASQAAVPFMQTRGGGAIINLGSIAGNNGGGPGSGLYASAKAFVHNVTRHMASDLAKLSIRVNAIAPGVIGTPFHDLTPADRMEAMRNQVPMQRIGTPEDCAGPIVFLASNRMSGYMTGQILHVNGGQMMPA